MPDTLEDWLKSIEVFTETDPDTMNSILFFRDPSRPRYIDNSFFWSPADGTIINQDFIEDTNEPLMEVKGKPYTLKTILEDDKYDTPSLVIEIFMSMYDVHVNRMPTSGCVNYYKLNKIQSRNIPMLFTEKELLKGHVAYDTMKYMQFNERMMNVVHCSALNYKYYMVQIADEDVDVIQPFKLKQGAYHSQNQRFSFVRWGSQVDLILPLDDRFTFETLCKVTNHVRAGLDKLIKITRN